MENLRFHLPLTCQRLFQNLSMMRGQGLSTPAAAIALWLLLIVLAFPERLQAQFAYVTNNGGIVITGYTGPGGDVVIPDSTNGLPVIDVRTNAFFSCTNITSLAIPGSITNIAYKAFTQCTGLMNVTIGNGTLEIEDYAFYDCTALTNVVVPASVTNIGSAAFRYCFALSTISLDPSNPSYAITDGVLFSKDGATLVLHPEALGSSYAIPPGVRYVADFALASCYALTNIDIPEGVLTIGNLSFDNLFRLKTLKLPDSLQSIGRYAFEYCSGLTNIDLGQGVSIIGTDAFNNCTSLGSVSIPGSVTNMGEKVFWYCTGLKNATVSEGVTSIGSGLFYGCSQLTSAVLPNSVTDIGGSTFWLCSALTNVTLGNAVTNIGDDAFYYCSALPGITLPNTIQNIGAYAFYGCSQIQTITLPPGLKTIGPEAFAICSGLTNVYIDGDAPAIGSSPFLGDLATIYYLPGTMGWDAPQLQSSGSNFGIMTNRFGFAITGPNGIGAAVQACTNLSNPTWATAGNFTITNGSFYYSDPQTRFFPARFYRLGKTTFGGRPVVPH
jgi:hypothetical protein